jgi:hypothetical protein
LKEVVRSTEDSTEKDKRWLLVFSEYAEIDVPNPWPGNRNPFFYTGLASFGLEFEKLLFQPMPEQEISAPTDCRIFVNCRS